MKTFFLTAVIAFACLTSPAAVLQQAYLKASNTGSSDQFGQAVAISGNTLLVGAAAEASASRQINGNASDNSAAGAGAAYVFIREGSNWTQQAYLKAANADAGDNFGLSVAISGDTIVVGAPLEDSVATGVNGNAVNNSASSSGAAYVFVREGTNWVPQAYLKASNTDPGDRFGVAVAISGDTILIGAQNESGGVAGVNGNQSDNSVLNAGAAYVFVRSGTNWTQQAYLKSSRPGVSHQFGRFLALFKDTAVISAQTENGSATGINGDQANTNSPTSGAVYVFVRDGTNWSQQAYVKASNTGTNDLFGSSIAVFGDTIAVGAPREDSWATGMNGDQGDNSAQDSGAVYIFVRSGTNWSQQAYIKASNTGASDRFGISLALWGDTLVVGADNEDSNATGIDGSGSDPDLNFNSGAAYVFTRNGTNWTQSYYLKSSNAEGFDVFGFAVGLDGDTAVIGAFLEDSSATGVNGNQADNSANNSGATYVFSRIANGPRLSASLEVDGTRTIRIDGLSGVTYQLERALDVTGPWTSNAVSVATNTGPVEFRDTNLLPSHAFYRVVAR